MNIKKAIRVIKERGHSVGGSKNKWVVLWGGDYSGPELTDRELISTAREYTSEGQKTPFKKNLKQDRHRRNRAKTKEVLAKSDYTKLNKNKLARDSNPWDWD